MSFFEEKLPSDGSKRVYFRPYTIEDAINISSMNQKLKERFTSRFLEIIQTGENLIDPRTGMTVQDRHTLLFKYSLLSLEAEKLNMKEEYKIVQCPVCGDEHSFKLSLSEMTGQLRNRILRQGESRVYTEFNGQKLMITSLKGEHAEHLELLENKMAGLRQSQGENSDGYQTVRVEKEIYRLICRFTLMRSENSVLDPDEQNKITEQWLYGLSASDFSQLQKLIQKKEEEIEHGISFIHHYPCPAFISDQKDEALPAADRKEGLVACRLPFRSEEFIPRI